MTARLGNAALVIALALALALGIATTSRSPPPAIPCLPTPTSRPSPHLIAATDSRATCETAESPAERAHAERSRRVRGCTEGARFVCARTISLYSSYHLVPVRYSLA